MRLPMAGHSAEEIRRWLQELLRLTDWKPSRLAQEAGLAPSTLNRFMRGGGEGFLLSTRTLGRIQQVGSDRIRQRIADGELSEAELEATLAGPSGMAVIHELGEDGSILARWGFPEDWFRFTYGTSPEDCTIVLIRDDAMAPDLKVNDRVIVDRRFRDPAKDGSGTYMLCTPAGPTARTISSLPDGRLMVSGPNKSYESYTSKPGRLEVLGRVAGMWRTLSAALTSFLPFVG